MKRLLCIKQSDKRFDLDRFLLFYAWVLLLAINGESDFTLSIISGAHNNNIGRSFFTRPLVFHGSLCETMYRKKIRYRSQVYCHITIGVHDKMALN